MTYDPNVYGYVNGQPCYSAEEFVYKSRGFGEIFSDRVLMQFAEKVTYGWQNAGSKLTFTSYYLSDYALAQPRRSLTSKEFARLQQLQQEAREAAQKADEAREWRLKETINWADNSVEEIWIDKDGFEKSVMTVQPHGDAC